MEKHGKKAETFKNFYSYQTVIPLFYFGDWRFHPHKESDWKKFYIRHGICDFMMKKVPNFLIEVVEFILHQITAIDNWGLTNASRLFNLA